MRSALLLALLACLPACSSTYQVRFFGDPQMNRVLGGDGSTRTPAPVQVKVVALKDDKRFLDLDLSKLWRDPKAELGDEVLAGPFVTNVLPGSSYQTPARKGETNQNIVAFSPLPEGATCFGVLARFAPPASDPPAQVQNRLVLPSKDASSQVVYLHDYQLELRTPSALPKAEAQPAPAAAAKSDRAAGDS